MLSERASRASTCTVTGGLIFAPFGRATLGESKGDRRSRWAEATRNRERDTHVPFEAHILLGRPSGEGPSSPLKGSSTAIARPGGAFIGSFWYQSTRNREADRLRPRVAYGGHMPGGGGRRKEGGRYGRRRSAHSTRLVELGRFRRRTPLDLDSIS